MYPTTPGPWTAIRQSPQMNYAWYVIESTERFPVHIATVFGTTNPLMDWFAGARDLKGNALLMAAAKELYEELESRYQQTRCGCGHPACKRCEDDRETERVLNKACGEN